jgi:hypothetical protein
MPERAREQIAEPGWQERDRSADGCRRGGALGAATADADHE